MAANNEIGVLQPFEEIKKICKEKGVPFNTNATQVLGKIPIDVDRMGIGLMSLNGHKIYSPKGVGALYLCRRPRIRAEPQMSGGGGFPYSDSVSLFSVEVKIGDITSTKILLVSGDRAVAQQEVLKKTHKVAKPDDIVSTITGDSLIIFMKKFHFPNDLVMKVLGKFAHVCSTLMGFLTVYEFSLQVGLRFSPPSELIDILRICGDLPIPIHVGVEDLLKVLNLPDVYTLHYEVRYLSRYIDEEFLFKVGLSTQAGRSHAHMLKKLTKVPEVIIQPSKASPKRLGNEGDPQTSKKKRVEEILTVTSKGHHVSPSKSHIPEDILKHQCIGRRWAEELNKRLQSLLSEKETTSKSEQSPSRVIKEFKKSVAFKMIIQDQIQEAHDHIYDVEVKALELKCMKEGFIRGFLKGVRLVQQKTGAEIKGLMPSQASSDSSLNFDGDEVESEL
ncbi:hypothetical protein IEQ34_008949 [Dendrobium chrysotoxum]|uniref:Aminotransferase class V domain-containing protein n=1 Tax=Dendrobium chrysotoxum TaxID=161865 RepID=A0AAV7H0Y5_DENCH|nr:hypothetical protein IEQ34_008949 [Dendrobium chrysotoxum]